MPNTGTVLSSLWFVRVTVPHDVLRGCIPGWVDIKRCLGVLHVGSKTGKEHAHFAIELASTIQRQSMSARLKKLYDLVGNKEIAVKVWDGSEDACQYLFASRSRPEKFVQIGFSDEQIESFRLNAKEYDARYEQKKISDKGPSPFAIAKELSEWSDESWSGNIDKDFYCGLVSHCISLHVKYGKTFCEFSLKRICDTAIGLMTKDCRPRSRLVQMVAEKYVGR